MPENRHLGERIERKLLELLERTVKLIEENRLEVLAVAHALETNKTVTGEDILAIIEGRKGPILDGRKYHSPEFRQLVEEYHTEAVRAHRSHGSVDLELPKLPSLDDIPVLEEAGAVAGSSGSIGSNGTEAPPAH